MPLILGLAGVLGVAVVGGLVALFMLLGSNDAPEQIRQGESAIVNNVPATDRESTEAVGIERPAPVAKQATETREQVLRDAITVFNEVEKFGDGLAEGDQSTKSAEELLEFLPKFRAILIRACQLAPVETSLQQAANPLSLETKQRPPQRPKDPNRFFWSVDTRNPQDKPVTLAVNQLTMVRKAIYDQLGRGVMELPSPVSSDDRDEQWSDEDRRVLEIIRTKGQLSRDFSFNLASVDIYSPTVNDLSLLHRVIDTYVKRAREIQKLPGDSHVFANVPRNSVFEKQQRSAFASVLGLRAAKFGEAWEDGARPVDAELEWLIQEYSRIESMIEELTFFSGKRTGIPRNGSRERYLAGLAAEKEAELAAAKEAEELAQQAEKERFAEIERKRQAKEKRELAEKKRQEERENRDRQLAEQRNQRGSMQPPFGPGAGRPGGPGRRGFGGSGRGFGPPEGFGQPSAGFGQPPAGFGQPRGAFGSRPQNNDRDTSNDVTIRIENSSSSDTKSVANSIPKWLVSYGVTVKNSNGNMSIEVQNFDKPLSELEDAFPDLEFTSIDEKTRTIVAKESD